MNEEVDLGSATARELELLFLEHGHGLAEEEMAREQVPLGNLEVAPAAFQFRDGSHRPWDKEHHIKNLVRALQRQDGFLDPLIVFPIAGNRIILDGHCRMMAYERYGLHDSDEVPIDHFEGSFSEALLRPAAENSKEKLPLTHQEKLEAAWKLVRFNENRRIYSYREIARCTGAGKSTVGTMTRLLESNDLGFDPRERSWKEVKRGRREEREPDEEWAEQRAEAWAGRIRKALGDKPNDTPECLFEALEQGYPQLFPQQIPPHWAEEADGLREIWWESADGEDDFDF